MNENFAKYVLTFLGSVYLLGSLAEIIMIKDGAQVVFESVKSLVPHMGMFILGFYFSRK